MKKLVFIGLLFGLVITLQAQITLIPDPNFEGYLINLGIDSDGTVNGQVLTSDIESITDFSIWGPNITDVTGIEDFASLEELQIINVNIKQLNISANNNLNRLEINDVSLVSLDVSNNTSLEHLDILDSDGGMFPFTINNLNISNNLNLKFLVITGTLLTQLDISNNQELLSLLLLETPITQIDLSSNTNLVAIEANRNNDLTAINLKNGVNTQIGWLRFLDNNNLQCVQVDDPTAVIAGATPPYDNWIIENNPIISEKCYLGISDETKNEVALFPNPIKEFLYINSPFSIQKVTIYSVLGTKLLEIAEDFNEVSLVNIPSGLLLVHVQTDKGNVIEKIVKE